MRCVCVAAAKFQIRCQGEDYLLVRDMELDCRSDTKQACYTRGETAATYAQKPIIYFRRGLFPAYQSPRSVQPSASCHHFQSQSSGWVLQHPGFHPFGFSFVDGTFPPVCVDSRPDRGVTRNLKWIVFLLLIWCLYRQTLERKAARHWTTALEPAGAAATLTSVTRGATQPCKNQHEGDFPEFSTAEQHSGVFEQK